MCHIICCWTTKAMAGPWLRKDQYLLYLLRENIFFKTLQTLHSLGHSQYPNDHTYVFLWDVSTDRPTDRFNFICIRVIIMRTLGKLLYLLTIVIMMLRITLYIRDEVIVEIIIKMIVEISYWTISWKFFTYMKLLHLLPTLFSLINGCIWF